MGTAKKVMAWAASQVGHKGGNLYWDMLGYGSAYYGQPWCCCFGDVAYKEGDEPIGSYVNCLTIQTGLKNAGAVQVPVSQAQAGDALIFEFDCAGDTYDHFGLCELNKGTYLQTIEGNVSNEVGRRTREYKYVRQCWRPKWDEDPAKKYTGWWWVGNKCYHYTNGTLDKNGWFKGTGDWAGRWFYVGDGGFFVRNQWHEGTSNLKGKWYYCGDNGWTVSNQWVKTNNQWYYCGKNGAAVTGWQTIDGATYHFDDEGVAEHNVILKYGTAYYYLGDDGKLQKGGTVTLKADKDGKLHL